LVSIDAIRIGERDRQVIDELDELAASIAAVGLLHPIVVTASLDLVAGGRRLAAVRQLGWTETPVTVVDWSNVEQALRAEADENTCRKPLSPVEASRMRKRRARILAPAIQENKGGRPPKAVESDIPQEGIWSEPDTETGAKSAPVPRVEKTKTRKAAAVGTGYSHASIDKVDEVLQIAEEGTRTVGTGKNRRTEPVPEPVRELAQQLAPALAQTGAAIEPTHRAVRRALSEFVDEDSGVKDAKYWEAFAKAVAAVTTGFLTYDPTRIAILDHDLTTLESVRDALARWFDTFDAASTGGTVTPLRRSS
jgi:ParB family chromosome partitioning protein